MKYSKEYDKLEKNKVQDQNNNNNKIKLFVPVCLIFIVYNCDAFVVTNRMNNDHIKLRSTSSTK
ncbi:hypothetical protein DERP_007641 [Dermatophagoides pteronyssinus]|uniref:Uncharacterized protein n=1 Tax=Dermatophagoides pteronyssinus TaxID=6956 RepID=A0ABQ8JKB2_DERPT|nr:hypothetical protein DERP_007641 [Dermatophagoides pteronyssinus]